MRTVDLGGVVESKERTFRWCNDFRRLSDMNVALLDRLGEYVASKSPDVSALRHILKAVRPFGCTSVLPDTCRHVPLVVACSVSPVSDDCICACM
jgi:hypothetical protein